MTELLIERLGAQGDGVANLNGAEVFVPFSVPGETVGGDIVEGRIAKPRIISPVPERVKAPCSLFKTCGGCAMQHIESSFLATWKQGVVADALAKHGLETDMRATVTSAPNSRRRAVFTGKRSKSGAFLAFHARGSSTLVPVTSCSLIHADISKGFDGLIALVMLTASRKSEVRISVTTSLGGLDIDISNALTMTNALQANVVKIAHDYGFSRVSWNDEMVLERLPAQQKFGNAVVTPPSGAFLQATQDGETALVASVQEIVGASKRVVDLFSGCGTFTLPLAENAEVSAYESESSMLEALDKGWRAADGLKRVETITRDLFRNPMRPEELAKFDAAVIDPPRAGAKAQTEHLALSGIGTIAFVSCNPATFARDARCLVDAGYALDWVQTIDQFLWSAHCELVAKFTKK